MKRTFMAIVPLLISSLAFPAMADILELKSGELLKGSFAGGTQSSVRFQVGNDLKVFPVSDIMAITFTGNQTAASAPQPVQPPPQAAPAPTPAVAAVAENLVIPAGSPFMIRTRSVLDSGRLGKGNKFTAALEADLVADGVVIAERGNTVYGRVVDVKKAGRVAGTAHIAIELTGIMIDNQIEPIATNVLTLTTESTQGSTAKKTVGAAALGGLISGSSGAKTGAKVGLGASILTPGNQVQVPAGTLLDFQFKVALKL